MSYFRVKYPQTLNGCFKRKSWAGDLLCFSFARPKQYMRNYYLGSMPRSAVDTSDENGFMSRRMATTGPIMFTMSKFVLSAPTLVSRSLIFASTLVSRALIFASTLASRVLISAFRSLIAAFWSIELAVIASNKTSKFDCWLLYNLISVAATALVRRSGIIDINLGCLGKDLNIHTWVGHKGICRKERKLKK